MDAHSFVSALLYALIGFDTFVSKPMLLYALSLPSSSLPSSLPDSLSPATSIVDDHQQHAEKSTNNGNKSRPSNNSVGSSANSNSIPVSKTKQTCKLSELRCPNGICIPLSKYCNGVPDCMDKSDEPADCNGELNERYLLLIS